MVVKPPPGVVKAICPACGGKLDSRGVCQTCGRQAVVGQERDEFNPEDKDSLRRWLAGEQGGLESWLGMDLEKGEKKAEETARNQAPAAQPSPGQPPPPKPQTPHPGQGNDADALRRWLTGDEAALESWLSQGAGPAQPAVSQPREGADDAELAALKAELVELRRSMKNELRNIKGGRFDPMKYLEEIARLTKDLQAQVEERKKLEAEVDGVKKSSVAALKYVKTQQPTGDVEALKKRMASEVENRRKVEIELKKTQALLNRAREELGAGLKRLPPDARVMKEKELQLAEKENQVKALEEQVRLKEESLRAQSALVGAPGSEELQKRLQAELAEKEREYLDRETELRKRTIELEGEIQRLQIEHKLSQESQQLLNKPSTEVNRELELKSKEIQTKEKSILLREGEIKRLQDELKLKEDEMKKLKEPLAYKEEELLRREEEMVYREKMVQEQLRKAEMARKEGGSVEEFELKQRLQGLKDDINKKEVEVRSKEQWLSNKMQELRAREQGLVQQEIVASEEATKIEVQQEKAKTGTSRLDDLLLGGIPFGSNITIYGPPFIGKEVIVNTFIAEGLKKGIPCLWVITDKMPSDVRDEMQFVLPSYQEYEKLGLVKYVDAYSKSMGADTGDLNAVYVNDPTDHEAILRAVDEVAAKFKAAHPYYRLAFRSVSTLIAYLDPTVTFKFLQPFAGRRKRDRAVAMYMIEKGMHGEQEIQMLGSVMDGMIDFKVEQLKTFMAIKGISDVQSRAWIQYMYSKQGVSIGSFSLEHIK